MLRATEQDLVPQPDAVVYLLVDVVAGKQLLLVQPAAYTAALEGVVEPPRERLICMAVADERREELDRFVQQRWQVVDELVRQAAATKKRERQAARSGKGSMIDATW